MSAAMARAAPAPWRRQPDEYIERAEALLPLLRRHAASDDASRCVHPDSIAAMKQAGLFRILQPRRLGGAELDLRTMHRVIRTLATASPSASWVLMVLLAHTWVLGMFDEEVQDEIAADDPETIIAGSLAPTGRAVRVDGGWRVSGRCPFASGTDHARWNLMGFKVAGDDPALPPAVHVLAPVRDYAVNDNWFTMGLRGTGSKELVLDDVFAPEHRTMPTPVLYGSLSPWGRRHPTWLHMMPVRPGLAYHLSAHYWEWPAIPCGFRRDHPRARRQVHRNPQGRQPRPAIPRRGIGVRPARRRAHPRPGGRRLRRAEP